MIFWSAYASATSNAFIPFWNENRHEHNFWNYSPEIIPLKWWKILIFSIYFSLITSDIPEHLSCVSHTLFSRWTLAPRLSRSWTTRLLVLSTALMSGVPVIINLVIWPKQNSWPPARPPPLCWSEKICDPTKKDFSKENFISGFCLTNCISDQKCISGINRNFLSCTTYQIPHAFFIRIFFIRKWIF